MTTDDLSTSLMPILADLGIELVDLEIAGGRLLVTVDRPGGVDLDTLASANRAISSTLDEIDPLPGRYLLEVSSPGVERRLRTPAHFRDAIGERIAVKVRTGDVRRFEGTLTEADDAGISIDLDEGTVRVALDDIDRARTVFVWGPPPRPSKRTRPAHEKVPARK